MIDSLSEKLCHLPDDKAFNVAFICKCSYAKVLLREYGILAYVNVTCLKLDFIETETIIDKNIVNKQIRQQQKK